MYFWEDIKIIALILSLMGFVVFLILGIFALFKKDKSAMKKLVISLLCFLIVCIGIVTDDTSANQTENLSMRVEKQIKI
jgi:glycerol uptake facilitator-like aquaporin